VQIHELTEAPQVLSVTCDNASANDKMIDELEEGAMPGFSGATNRTRCFDHVVNIVARTVVRRFDVPKGGKTDADAELSKLAEGIDAEEEIARAELESLLGGEVENESDDDESVMLDDDDEQEEFDENVRPVRLLLVKVSFSRSAFNRRQPNGSPQLRRLAFAILHSTTILLPAWFALLETLKVGARKMPRDVTTRWNSTYDMLVFALEYRTAIDRMCAEKGNGLRKFEMSGEEWIIAGQLRDVLKVCSPAVSYLCLLITTIAQVFKDATLFFSRATPNLASVIPAMDHIDERLATGALNRDFNVAIRVSLSLAKKTLNRYYEKTDQSFLYRTAMSESRRTQKRQADLCPSSAPSPQARILQVDEMATRMD
jgi:hypothetical protein